MRETFNYNDWEHSQLLGCSLNPFNVMKESASTLETLYKQYVIPNLEYCKNITLRYIGVYLELEDTFVMVQTYLYNNIKYYDPNKPLHTFLHVCIKRYVNTLSEKRYKELVAMEIIKNNKQLNRLIVNGSSEILETGNFDDYGTFCLSQSLYCGIMTLKPIDRKIFLLYYLEGYNCVEISSKIGKSHNYIRRHLTNARDMIKYKMTGKRPKYISLHSYIESASMLNKSF